MKPKTAVFIIAIFGILVVVAAYVKRGELSGSDLNGHCR